MTEGIINILKPPGMTSSDAVADVRHIFRIKRVGHTGTLDPGAAGVLPICIGRATRLFDVLVDKQKEYIAEITFGIATDTQDAYGRIIEKAEATSVPEERLVSALEGFRGEIEQTAPMYSAVSIDGKRLYQLAREGAQLVEIKRKAYVAELELLHKTKPNSFLLRMVCSRGTYVRTICSDIGKAMGVPAYMSFLLRTRSGEFTIENAYSIAELKKLKEEGRLEESVINMEQALNPIMEKIRLENLSEKQAKLIRNGADIFVAALKNAQAGKLVMVYDEDEFLGVGQTGNDGSLHIKLNLTEGNA